MRDEIVYWPNLSRASGGVPEDGDEWCVNEIIFPALAGVFPHLHGRRYADPDLPRASGGVPLTFLFNVASVISSPR